MKRFNEFLKLYRQQNWDLAEAILSDLIAQYPERLLYTLYLDRIASYRVDSPGDFWDGVFTHKTK